MRPTAWPTVSGAVRKSSMARATSARAIAAEDLSERVELVGSSLLESVTTGDDLYILRGQLPPGMARKPG
jgi:hypothetical protein